MRARTILFEFHLFMMHSEFKNSAMLCVMSIPGGGWHPGPRHGAAAPGVRGGGTRRPRKRTTAGGLTDVDVTKSRDDRGSS